jgi:ribosomal protein L16 Arg81 hydroxylase
VQHVRLNPGDALYIPDTFWHVIRSTGRNIGLAVEFAPPRDHRRLRWTEDMMLLERHPGALWAEKLRLLATAREAYARSQPWAKYDECSEPMAQVPRNLAEYTGWQGPHYG